MIINITTALAELGKETKTKEECMATTNMTNVSAGSFFCYSPNQTKKIE